MEFLDFSAQSIVLISRVSILFAEARFPAINYLKLKNLFFEENKE
jgi:hypothetical protein